MTAVETGPTTVVGTRRKRKEDPRLLTGEARFVDALVRNGVRVTVRRSKGRDIAAACGQLRGKEVAKSRATGGREVRERP